LEDATRYNQASNLKGYSKSIRKGGKAIISADINIEGIERRTLKAFSGPENFNENFLSINEIAKSQYAPFESDPILKAYRSAIDSKITSPRISDTEIKIFEQVVRSLQGKKSSVSGKIRFIGDRETCYSCQKVALNLREMYPNIKLEFVYRAEEKNSRKLLYNQVRNWASGLRWDG
jgi:hypothetical protein